MTNPVKDISLRQAAFIAGWAIIIMTVAAVIATDLTIGSLIVENDARATAENIITSEILFRTGVLSWLIILICDALAAWGLYIYLKPVNPDVSLIMAWFRLLYVAILAAAVLYLVDVLSLVNGNGIYQGAFGSDQLQSLIYFSVKGFYRSWSIGLIVFGIHILLLGYLIVRSDHIPAYWGILLIIAGFGYLIINLAELVVPGYENIKRIIGWIFIIPMLGEVGLGLWLLIKGTKRGK